MSATAGSGEVTAAISSIQEGLERIKMDERKFNKLLPSIFNECHPIINMEDIDGVIQNPPQWINRVEPLKPRSTTLVQNTMSDCHTESKNFFARSRIDSRSVPKTLICHDYKGGYQNDKYLNYPNEEVLGNGYTFYNWAQIDIFVYFSHHLITIPPLSWINAAHANGVKVLGTVITEFNSGAEICNKKIFKSEETMRNFARSLVEIARLFGFDGWLLNIENPVENVGSLKQFVKFLSDLMHANHPEKLIIWYDSVTCKGELLWQNELNDKNRCFFDSCDGIFLNYTWTEKHLINSVVAAEHRNLDVYVGIDVFGRNMFGGGKFGTYKAAEIVSRNNLSMAIFAPGWTHETLDQKSDNFFKEFLNRDSAFWCTLWPYFYTHPVNDYFCTNFYVGLDMSCYNIFSQQLQCTKFLHPQDVSVIPDHKTIPALKNKCDCLQASVINSKNTCLITKENVRRNLEYVHRLFLCEIEIVDNTVVFFLTKNLEGKSPAKLSVKLLTCGINGSIRKISLLSLKQKNCIDNGSLLEVNQTEAVDVYESVKKKYIKMIEEDKWILSVYLFNTSLCNIMEIGGIIEGEGDSLYLGAFGVQNADGTFLRN